MVYHPVLETDAHVMCDLVNRMFVGDNLKEGHKEGDKEG